MREQDARAALQDFCEDYVTKAAAARALGVHRAFLHHMLYDGKSIPESVMKRLGLKRIIVKESR